MEQLLRAMPKAVGLGRAERTRSFSWAIGPRSAPKELVFGHVGEESCAPGTCALTFGRGL